MVPMGRVFLATLSETALSINTKVSQPVPFPEATQRSATTNAAADATCVAGDTTKAPSISRQVRTLAAKKVCSMAVSNFMVVVL